MNFDARKLFTYKNEMKKNTQKRQFSDFDAKNVCAFLVQILFNNFRLF